MLSDPGIESLCIGGGYQPFTKCIRYQLRLTRKYAGLVLEVNMVWGVFPLTAVVHLWTVLKLTSLSSREYSVSHHGDLSVAISFRLRGLRTISSTV